MKNTRTINVFITSIILCSFFLTGCQRTELVKASAISNESQSIWIWEAAKEMSPSGIKALKELNVDTIYLNTGWDMTYHERYLKEHEWKYAIFMDNVHQTGVHVQALLGESTWALSKNYKNLETEVKTILNYNKEYKYRFTAVHLDIEPHLLEGWENNIENYLTSYLENIQKIKKLINKHNLEEDDTLTLALDIPFWYAQDKYKVKGNNIVDLLLQTVDEINVMTYTQNQADFVNWAKEVLSIADNYPNKIIKIAVEFNINEKGICLYEFEPEKLIEYVGNSIKEFKKYSSFEGLAIHDYTYYMLYLTKNGIVK